MNKDLKDNLEMIIKKLGNLDVYEMDITDYGCDCCSNHAELIYNKKLKDENNPGMEDVIKAEDVKGLIEGLKLLIKYKERFGEG